MTLDKSLEYIFNKAKEHGYTDKQISLFMWEVADMINHIEDCSTEELDKVYEELF